MVTGGHVFILAPRSRQDETTRDARWMRGFVDCIQASASGYAKWLKCVWMLEQVCCQLRAVRFPVRFTWSVNWIVNTMALSPRVMPASSCQARLLRNCSSWHPTPSTLDASTFINTCLSSSKLHFAVLTSSNHHFILVYVCFICYYRSHAVNFVWLRAYKEGFHILNRTIY